MRNRLTAAVRGRLAGRRSPAPAAAPMPADGYDARLDAEREIYAEQEVVHGLPAIFHYWSHTHLLPMLEDVGIATVDELFAGAFERAYHGRDGTARFASIGAGNCDAEVRLAQDLLARGCDDFEIDCLELNPVMLERGAALAAEAGVDDHVRGVEADFNAWTPAGRYDGVLANQALHHVVNLEGLYDAILGALAPTGRFVTSDMIGRNGHQRWPEARRIVDELWPELPAGYRVHHTLGRTEEAFQDWDCSQEGFEGIRAQDVLPLLVERFHFETFLAFGNVIDVFIDRGFGPNFDPDRAWDRAFVDRVHARDMDGLRSGELKPTHVMAVMRTQPVSGGPRIHEGLSPEFCVRRP